HMAKDWQVLSRLGVGSAVEILRARLVEQDVVVEGPFELPPLARLSSEDQTFVAAFVRCHGSIKQMEQLFRVSYPTIKNRLNRIGALLPFVEVAPESPRPSTNERRVERGGSSRPIASEGVVMSEETRRVLDLLAQGKIKVDEADRLLAAIGLASTDSTPAGAAGKGAATTEAPPPKYLRITVTKTRTWSGDDEEPARRARMWPGNMAGRNREVAIRVPVALVRNGMRLGAMIPGLAGAGLQARLRERGVDVDLSKIDADTIDRLVSEFGEMNIDVSGHGGNAKVRITCE